MDALAQQRPTTSTDKESHRQKLRRTSGGSRQRQHRDGGFSANPLASLIRGVIQYA